MANTTTDMLKLVALENADLDILSAYIQDAVTRVGDMQYLASEKKFALIMNRFVWEKDTSREPNERRRTALHFERVEKAQTRNILKDRPDGVLSLLAVKFTPTDEPAGTIDLFFSGDGQVRLTVECVEAQLSDLGGAWETANVPEHDLG